MVIYEFYLISYSSVAHMSVVILGLFSNTIQGIEGAILLALAHGFVSPALFICVGGIIYDRTGTRIIHYVRGLITLLIPTVLLGIFPNMILDGLHFSISTLLFNV